MRVPRTTRRFIEILANVAIVIVAAVIVTNFVWPKIHPKQRTSFGPSIGSTVSLPGIEWKENRNTLLMVLQKGCIYCEQSAPFYKQLRDSRIGNRPRMIVVIPGEAADTAHYLSDRGISVDGIINAPLNAVDVSATPTLLLTDQLGRINNVWVGKLDETRQKEVIRVAFETH